MTMMRGSKQHPLYNRWKDIKKRCHSPFYKDYYNYGGRGIEMCDEWFHSFSKFASYIEENLGLQTHLQLDRIDNNGHYEPGNMRWSTPRQNRLNTRYTHVIKKERECMEINSILGFGI